MAPYKPIKRDIARELRLQGVPIKQIARRLGVSPSSVLVWTDGIVLTAEQRERNERGPRGPQNPARVAERAASIRRSGRARRRRYQEEGRARAREGDLLHLAGCMLYWAEGAKARNAVKLSNPDIDMVRYFRHFLTESLDVSAERFRLSLQVYLGNGLTIEQIEERWLHELDLPRSALRKHAINPLPTSSSGRKKNKLPYGVATLYVHDTRLVQHLYGAIREYAGFEEPRWLDGGSQRGAS